MEIVTRSAEIHTSLTGIVTSSTEIVTSSAGILTSLLIWSLIVYRIATDVAEMDGPFDVFMLLRSWAMERMPAWVVTGIQCPICISFWLTAIVVLMTGDWRLCAVAGVVRLIVDWRHGRE